MPNSDDNVIDTDAADLLRQYREEMLDFYSEARRATMEVIMQLPDEALLTSAEVALAIMYDAPHASAVSNLIRTGRLPAVRRGAGVRITAAAVRAYLSKRDARRFRLGYATEYPGWFE